MNLSGKLTVGNIEAKNLFNENMAKNITNYSVYGSLTSPNWISFKLILKPNTKYTFSRTDNSGYGSNHYLNLNLDGNTNNGGIFIIHSGDPNQCRQTYTFTTASDGVLLFTWTDFAGNSQNSLNTLWSFLKKVQIEESETATDYTEYQGIGYTSGSNANGSWVKYADGRMECTKHDVSTVGGQLTAQVNFPATFVDNKITIITTSKYYHTLGVVFTVAGVTTTKFDVYPRYNNATCQQAESFGYIAIGRWK